MPTLAENMRRIGAASRPEGKAEDFTASEQALALCLVTAAMAHRRYPFSGEVAETVANQLIRRLDLALSAPSRR
jgi:hypothetical protein